MSRRKQLTPEKLSEYMSDLQLVKEAFDKISHHVVISDPNGNILYANKAVKKQTGYNPKEIIGKNPGDLWGGNMPADYYEDMWRTIKEKKQPFVGDVKNRRQDGTEYWQGLFISPVLAADNSIRYFIAIEPNITEQKELEVYREEFLAILSHQLRDPLAAIRWAVEHLLTRQDIGASTRTSLKAIYKQSNDLSSLVGDLLVLSKSGSAAILPKRINLVSFIGDVIKQVQETHKNASVNYKPAMKEAQITTIPSLTEQVFVNIISNATEYADPGNPIVTVELEKEDDTYIFSCENNGPSIPLEEQEKVFEPGQRGVEAEQKRPEGAGLGMHIVQIIAESFNWSVSFISPSSRNMGTKFSVRIPGGKSDN